MEVREFLQMDKLENSHWWFVAKRAFIESVFPKAKNLKILDIGAGTGGTTKFLQKYGKVIGLEPNQLARNLAKKKGIKLIAGSAQKLPIKAQFCHLVCFFDVIYHKGVKSDSKALKEAYRVLKPEGYLIITDSAFEFLKGPHDLALHARKRYTKKEMVNLIELAGFQVEKASYIFFFIFPVTLVKRLASKLTANLKHGSFRSDVKEVPNILNKILIKICALEAYLLKLINFLWGSSIIIRAKKIS